MKNYTRRNSCGLLSATIVILAGCGGSDTENLANTGFLSLGVSDGPVHDADKVCISFNEVELKSGSETRIIDIDPPRIVNLLDFQGNNAAPLLIEEEVTAGDYQWMRLGIDAVLGASGGADDTRGADCDGNASYMIMKDGRLYNLYVPSGEETGLKLVSGFTVPANGSPDFTAEFDLGRSLTAPPGLDPDVILKPVIRLVNNVEVGTLTGMVATQLATADECAPSVHLFDDGVTPNPNDSVATAIVSEQMNADGSMTWNYTIGFLQAPADYEAAFTCDGSVFEPVDGNPAPIAVGETKVVDFTVPAP